jgi:hypothetical protein
MMLRQTTAVTSAVITLLVSNSAAYSTCAYIIATSLLAAAICVFELRPYWASDKVGDSPIRDGVAASISQVPLDTLEHVDKFVLAALIGWAGLAEYALGVATGRLLFFALKPLQILLASRHVRGHLPVKQLVQIGLWGTVLGVAMAALMYFPFIWFYGPEYLLSYQIAAVLLGGAGIYSVGQIMLQWSVLNEGARVSTVVINNLLTPSIVLLTLVCVYFFWRDALLFAFAASYVFRHLFSIVIIGFLQFLRREKPNDVAAD